MYSLDFSGLGSSFKILAKPRIALRGVLISWLTLAINDSFAKLDLTASSFACFNSLLICFCFVISVINPSKR